MRAEVDAVRALLIEKIAADIGLSIANLGFPVGMGIPLPPDLCERAAANILDRISARAHAVLAGHTRGEAV